MSLASFCPPEVIQSLILGKLKQDAEARVGPIRQAVITVPAYFNEPRRKATQDAGRLANLEVLDIINEPTAAAIAYGREAQFLNERGASSKSERILVYDLGGGTFDVTLMSIDGKQYSTIATAGDVHLGGIDWDDRIVDLVIERFSAKYPNVDLKAETSAMRRLLSEAEDAKRALTSRPKVTLTFEHQGRGVRVPISRDEFEELTADLRMRSLFTTRNLLRDVGMKWSDLTRLLMVGGSTRMPSIQQSLREESGMDLDFSLSVDESVAHGAAIYAGILMNDGKSTSSASVGVKNVNSHSLGVLAKDPQTGRPKNSVLIPKNSQLPFARRKTFKTAKANQTRIAIRIIEGGDSSGRNATIIGVAMIPDLPPNLPLGTEIEVSFIYRTDG